MATVEPASTAVRLLFIGNSYTNRNDLPGLLTALAAAGEPPIRIHTERVIANGASLRQHWNAGHAAQLIREQPCDVIVLQEQSTLPLKNRQRYHENVRLFAELIRPTGSRLALYQTWARQNAPETQDALNAAVDEIARETGALVLPVGVAWRHARQIAGVPELFDKDGSHPTLAGSFLAACVFHHTLFGVPDEELPVPIGLALPRHEAQLLLRVARAAV